MTIIKRRYKEINSFPGIYAQNHVFEDRVTYLGVRITRQRLMYLSKSSYRDISDAYLIGTGDARL